MPKLFTDLDIHILQVMQDKLLYLSKYYPTAERDIDTIIGSLAHLEQKGATE